MNVIKTFEARVADAFGAAPQGYTAPISFRKLAKRAAKEMEAETFVIDGVDTAPALYTVLVATADDVIMRPVYPQLTAELVAFVEAQAAQRGYLFVAAPLARFMVDPTLKPGKFAVFAENIDYETLERLRAEEEDFLHGGTPAAAVRPAPQGRRTAHVMPAVSADKANSHDNLADGFDVVPADYLAQAQSTLPPTQLRGEAPHGQNAVGGRGDAPATCLLVDRTSGRTYTGTAPGSVIGRERTAGGIVLRDPNVSRRHAELTFDGQHWHIRDLSSTNGTLVNDADVTECALHDGDLVTLGLTNLEFRESA